jgi:Carboxypeptidase regulatory-like domain
MLLMKTIFAFVLLASAINAQTTGNGVIQGIVKDPSGAVIAATQVTVENVATSQKHTTTTNGVGFYLFPALHLGDYALSAEAPGMQPWQGRLTLQVGQTAVVDITMSVSSTSSQVTVAGDVTPLLTLNSSTMATVLERTRIEQLPLNGRFLQNLVLITVPGLEGVGDGPHVNGLTRSAMEFLQDGVNLENRDADNAIAGSRPPGIDTVQEFRVETINSSAKMSRPATVIISTRSGTNQLHGALFETARNNAIGVARQRQEFYDKPPHLVRNEFGASAGGPVHIPHVYNGTNRTFFFFAWEAYRNAQASTLSTNLPTVAMRQGNFSALTDATGRGITLYDPWTTDSKTWQRQPFPGNIIPTTRESPVAKYILGVTPLPNLPNVNPLVANNYAAPSGVTRREYTETLRVDHRFSERDQIFGRYNFGHRDQPTV